MTSLTTPSHLERDTARPSAEAANRRTFAIISHPDAGKTTLTEKFLLYAGAVQEAGAVRARAGRRRAASDWMALEQERGHLDQLHRPPSSPTGIARSTSSTRPATATSPRTPTAS